MTTRSADTLLLSRDLVVLQMVSEVLPEARLDCRQSFSSALLGITADTQILLIDAAAGVPMAHLLAALFLDQQPGRTAVVVLPRGAACPPDVDPRVQVLSRPLSVRALLSALMAGAQSASAFRDLSSLTRHAAAVR